MTFSILLFNYRKPGVTPAEFRAKCEALIPLIKEITGQHFPLAHTRRYLLRTEGKGETERNPTTPATVPRGSQADFDYDAIAELTFADQAAFGKFIALMQEPDNAKRIAEAEDEVMDKTKSGIVVLGETIVTTKD
ncbi:hypothetical protein PFICI_13858 [Pestalotiopsis fici W106-1]|uniref:EthD domain-containing protein n=1 Tax=Pestalotiopsis fici (strain W106-1 / CGMCC3.15140) TaxID=1229662 RepID=W3WLE7_PESFW|nr:uncharacterized protein PFICI_13858 [Pestalotiopsis fici W106-1]ETS73992.1 hypothetical protein PFICI_13858 [Pestalotiopsis fici W106-1]